jgi:FtsP/CotA-like multicopper oxidase with cupredoxin domain
MGGTALAGGLMGGSASGQTPAAAKDDPHAGHVGHGTPAVSSPDDRGKLTAGRRKSGEPVVPVEAPDIPKLPWKLVDGAKEFHLHAQHMKREFLPGQWFDVWGYNGSMPGPTIEVVEGDRVRVIVHNELPEPTSMHWHGLEVPIAMDGVPGVTQDAIPPGGSFTYEFTLRQNGTFFYHTHGAMQEALGLVGLFIVHPKSAHSPPVDKDFALVLQEWAILPGATVTNTMSMEFNLFTINGRSAPYITPLIVRLGDRVRIRLMNFSVIDHHPMHLHGLTFWVTGTEGGRIPETAWYPSNNVLVGVAQVREIEFIANNPGDWIMHCHMFHHMMNFMASMVGPMGGHTRTGMAAGGSMATGMGMLTRGPALSEDLRPMLGRGTGELTGDERAVGNGGPMPAKNGQDPHAGHGAAGKAVPGFPQDMSAMVSFSDEEVRKLNKPETRGMRRDWFTGVEGLMTVVRVLPPDLYEKVTSGKGEVATGASVPGATPGKAPTGHDGHGDTAAPEKKGHEGHDVPKKESPKADGHKH